MTGFTNSLKTEWLDNGKWRVTESFRFYSGEQGSSIFVEVPEGFVTDLASVPRALRWLVPKVGKDSMASIVHDRLYATGTMSAANIVNDNEYLSDSAISRSMADGMYHQAMKALRVGRWRRIALYHAVSAFGWVAWNRYRNAGKGMATETTL